MGGTAIHTFLVRKWNRELDYRLVKALWAFHDRHIAVRFAYEWYDDSRTWFRSYGNRMWKFNDQKLMIERHGSINDFPIPEGQRLLRWPLGTRPTGAPELDEPG